MRCRDERRASDAGGKPPIEREREFVGVQDVRVVFSQEGGQVSKEPRIERLGEVQAMHWNALSRESVGEPAWLEHDDFDLMASHAEGGTQSYDDLLGATRAMGFSSLQDPHAARSSIG